MAVAPGREKESADCCDNGVFLPGKEDVILTLQSGGMAMVQAWDASHGPVAEALVMITAIHGVPVRSFSSAITDREGRAELAVPAGLIELTIDKKNLEAKVNVTVFRGANVPAEAVLQVKER